jgi:enterochelin esterase family protein
MMMSLKQFITAVSIVIMTGSLLAAQAPPVRSPEVNADHTVTFRLRAPQASAVDLVGEVLQGKGPQRMVKGSDGVWTITIGPLPPEIWIYNFRIEGVDLPDPANISIMPRAAGTGAISSFVEVPGRSAAFYDSRTVTHGEVRMVLYRSKAMGVDRYLWVYTPPNYDKSTTKYPVYYLLHGNGETQAGWIMNGRANIILDNLIAEGKAQPMVVVMPHGHALQSASVGPIATVTPAAMDFRDFTLFTKEFLEEIIPTIEKNYRVYADADHRAIGGLSMGAMQSVSIGLSHPELFHYVLAYSGGFGSLALAPAPGPVEEQAPWKQLLANSVETKKWLHLLFLGSGQQETGMVGPGQRLVQLFREHGINALWADHTGGHVFSVWRNHLNESVPLLFQRRD